MTRTIQMPESSILVDATTDHVWGLLAENFDRLDDWSSGLDRSEAIELSGSDVGAPVPGRICYSSTPGFREIEERIISFSESDRTFTYEASGAPKVVGTIRNSWFVEPTGPTQCRVGFRPSIEVGPVGWVLGKLMSLIAGDRIAKGTLKEFKHFAETGEQLPIPAKAKKRSVSSKA